MRDTQHTITELRARLIKQLAEFDAQEDHYLDLIGDPDWPQDKIKARLRTTRERKQRVQRQLDDTTNDLNTGRQVLLTALDLLEDPHRLYQHASEPARKILNKAIFTRLYLDHHDHTPQVAGEALTEPFDTLVRGCRDTQLNRTLERDDGALPNREGTVDRRPLADLLRTALEQRCSSKARMVEVAGIEPLTPSLRPGCQGIFHWLSNFAADLGEMYLARVPPPSLVVTSWQGFRGVNGGTPTLP